MADTKMHTVYAMTVFAIHGNDFEHQAGLMPFSAPVPQSHAETEVLAACQKVFPSTGGWRAHTVTVVPLSDDAVKAKQGYVFSLLAFNAEEREIDGGVLNRLEAGYVGNKAFYTVASNVDDANESANAELANLFPADEGWFGHRFVGDFVNRSKHQH